MTAPRQSLPFTDERHLTAHHWLVEEAYLLDQREHELWLDLLTDDICYRMPVRVTTARGSRSDVASGIAHFDEDKYSLARRVARFATEHAFTEDPPSRTTHHTTNVRTFATELATELRVESAVLLFRSRGDIHEPSVLSARRDDVLRLEEGRWRLARRTIMADESVLRMQNLAVFL